MGGLSSPRSGTPSSAEVVLSWAQLLSPCLLLLCFVLGMALHGVLASRKEEDMVPAARGPGGRPLPLTKMRTAAVVIEVAGAASFGRGSRRVFQLANAIVVLSYAANAANLALQVANDPDQARSFALDLSGPEKRPYWCREEAFVYIVGCGSFYAYLLLTLFDWSDSPNAVHFLVWATSLVTDGVVFGSLLARILQSCRTVDIRTSVSGGYNVTDLAIGTLRIAVLIGLVLLYLSLAGRRTFWAGEKRKHEAGLESMGEVERQTGQGLGHESGDASDETTPLLGRRHAALNGYVNPPPNARDARKSQNGSVGTTQPPVGTSGDGSHRDADAAFYRPNKLPHKTWWEYLRGYSLFFPYLWPRESLRLQLVVLFCFALALLQRYVTIMVPIQTGHLVTELDHAAMANTGGGGHGMPWRELGLLILFKILQGPSGLLGSLRSILWIPVSQYCFRALSSAAFEHVHSLSLDFHLSKRTGEVLSALNKGASINSFLEQVTFQVFPMLVDPLIAIVYLACNFNSVYAVCVSIMTFTYLFLTIRMAATRADQRRDMVNASREEEAVKNDSIVSYETVKYFNAEDFEFKRYRQAISTFQAAEASVTWGANNMNICQNLVFMSGLLLLLVVGAYDVAVGNRDIGQFSTLLVILGQLQGPLNFFGTFYKTVQQAMISGERLLELFKVAPTVVDLPGVPALPSPCRGHIRWNKVRFWYDGKRPALRDISFECRPGTTTAFVGESGGGKSTVFRLMFRYYNCHEGSIQVDGHNVKDVSIDSVRRAIGVVPQDTILFNETIMYNLKYANKSATDEEVYEACRSASIHERIMGFPDGYNTRVGERGLRLSGGEKQRVAIARLILKRPRIIMLDEATSALDSETEQQIQSKLIKGNNLGQDRTLLIIAHRLSTITHADQIIVLHAGSIIEKGSHSELLRLGGKYASMWEKQSKAEEAAVKARDATARANKLLRRAQIGVKSDLNNDDSDGCNNSACSSTVLPGPTAAVARCEDSSTSDDDSTNNDNVKTK